MDPFRFSTYRGMRWVAPMVAMGEGVAMLVR